MYNVPLSYVTYSLAINVTYLFERTNHIPDADSVFQYLHCDNPFQAFEECGTLQASAGGATYPLSEPLYTFSTHMHSNTALQRPIEHTSNLTVAPREFSGTYG